MTRRQACTSTTTVKTRRPEMLLQETTLEKRIGVVLGQNNACITTTRPYTNSMHSRYALHNAAPHRRVSHTTIACATYAPWHAMARAHGVLAAICDLAHPVLVPSPSPRTSTVGTGSTSCSARLAWIANSVCITREGQHDSWVLLVSMNTEYLVAIQCTCPPAGL